METKFNEILIKEIQKEIDKLESLPISSIPDEIDEEIDFNLTLYYLKLANVEAV
ncbi:MAG: hypothetical protein ACYDCP_11015 [Thermoplasmataceae archaeon]